jgi:transposase-like protein
LEGRPVSEICEQAGIHPTLFYQWQRTFFENGAAAFSSPRTGASGPEQKIEALQDKLKRKDEVIAEIMEDFIAAKKELGES